MPSHDLFDGDIGDGHIGQDAVAFPTCLPTEVGLVKFLLEPPEKGNLTHVELFRQLCERVLLVLPFLDLLPKTQWLSNERLEQGSDLLFLIETSQREEQLRMFRGMKVCAVHAATHIKQHQVDEFEGRLPNG